MKKRKFIYLTLVALFLLFSSGASLADMEQSIFLSLDFVPIDPVSDIWEHFLSTKASFNVNLDDQINYRVIVTVKEDGIVIFKEKVTVGPSASRVIRTGPGFEFLVKLVDDPEGDKIIFRYKQGGVNPAAQFIAIVNVVNVDTGDQLHYARGIIGIPPIVLNPIGTLCNNPSECESGYCVDGVCCDSSCSGTCQACSSIITGAADGTCAYIPDGSDPEDECTGTDICNGAGGCRPTPAACNPGDTYISTEWCDPEGYAIVCVPGRRKYVCNESAEWEPGICYGGQGVNPPAVCP